MGEGSLGGGLLHGVDWREYQWENLLYPMWWVSSEGAVLLTVLSVVTFLLYTTLCPARAGECSLNVHEASGHCAVETSIPCFAGCVQTFKCMSFFVML